MDGGNTTMVDGVGERSRGEEGGGGGGGRECVRCKLSPLTQQTLRRIFDGIVSGLYIYTNLQV